MKILNGLMPGQVLQRNSGGMAIAKVTGTCGGSGTIEARLPKQSNSRKIQDWKPVGQASHGKFEVLLQDIPSGGPYEICLRLHGGDEVKVTDIFVEMSGFWRDNPIWKVLAICPLH